MNIGALKHQANSLWLLKNRPDIPYVFLIGGYGCGKSFSDVIVMLWLYQMYRNSPEPVTIGVIGVTIKLLSQTVLADFERFCDSALIPYKDNSRTGTLTVGNLTFVYLPMENPDDIYAFNFHAAIVDEIDEVPPERVLKIVQAIQERCRKAMPRPLNRDPFIFFSTTAQGLGGTYQLTKYFEQRGVPYAIVRGRTQDNPHLAKSQIQLLEKLYTEEERRAYLEGEFVNLTTGRVFWAYNAEKHKLPQKIVPGPDEQIYVAQDFNWGCNASVVMVERAGAMFIIEARYWKDTRDIAIGLRSMYPTQPIELIPDASGKEIMQGISNEFDERQINVFWNNRNPSIAETIMACNKALSWNQLFICITDDMHSELKKMEMVLETHDFDDNTGKPRKGAGRDAPDHMSDCLRYALWRIIHQRQGYSMILQAVAGVGKNRAAA